jgi:TatD DNase family protein
MLETDCPYMSPAPMRKKKPNEPALLIHIAEKLAELHNISLEELSKITVKNSRYFFGI